MCAQNLKRHFASHFDTGPIVRASRPFNLKHCRSYLPVWWHKCCRKVVHRLLGVEHYRRPLAMMVSPKCSRIGLPEWRTRHSGEGRLLQTQISRVLLKLESWRKSTVGSKSIKIRVEVLYARALPDIRLWQYKRQNWLSLRYKLHLNRPSHCGCESEVV